MSFCGNVECGVKAGAHNTRLRTHVQPCIALCVAHGIPFFINLEERARLALVCRKITINLGLIVLGLRLFYSPCKKNLFSILLYGYFIILNVGT